VRFVMLGDAAPASRRMGADAALEPLSRWVRENGRRIEARAGDPRRCRAALALYDWRKRVGS
jgi:hypothetical protein